MPSLNTVGFTLFICLVTLKSTDSQQQQQDLKYDVRLVENWPKGNVTFGQLSAVAFDNDNNIVVFHRGLHVWDEKTFWPNNSYALAGRGPIEADTVVVFSNLTGAYVRSWGAKRFYMPHGLTVDADGNIWLTDVALHQVFKCAPGGQMVLLTLGEKFEPGSDDLHFCKPTAVAVLDGGDFFVADGYCNSRIVKYSAAGGRLLQWGLSDGDGVPSLRPTRYSLFVPHALAVVDSARQVCVADREHGRIVCYDYSAGEYRAEYKFPDTVGYRLFSLAYAPVDGGKFYVVNGPNYQPPYYKVQGFVVSIPDNRVEASFGSFENPHDIAVNALGSVVYVVEYKPARLHKFEIQKGDRMPGQPLKIEAHPPESAADQTSATGGRMVLVMVVTTIVCLVVFMVYYFGYKKMGVKRYGLILEDDTDGTESVSLVTQESQE